MDCPYCGGEMEDGFLQCGGTGAIGWLKKPSTFPTIFNMESLDRHRGKYGEIPASRCSECRKVVFSY